MGDVILVSALFSALKKENPHSEITFLTDSQYVELFRDDSRLSSVLGLEKKTDSKLNPDFLKTQWDLVVDLQRNRRSRKLLSLLKNKRKVGVFSKQYLKRVILLVTRVGLYSDKDRIVCRYIRAAGIKKLNKESHKCEMFFDSQISDNIQSLFKTKGIIRPLIALFPFAAWKNKVWSEENFVDVGRFFHVKGWDVCIMGGPQEREKGEKLAQLIGQRCFSLAGKMTLYECGCFLKECSLALGNDTGLSHLARACGIKTGIIYGATTRHWGFYPHGEPPFTVFESNCFCRPCHAHGGNYCLIDRVCLKKISSEKVIKGLMNLVENSK